MPEDKYRMQYYLYHLKHPLDGVAFYVGIAKATDRCPIGFRPARHIKEAVRFRDENYLCRGANLHKLRTILQIIDEGLEVVVDIVFKGMTKSEAIAREVCEIATIGRRDIGTGPLTNLTGGGDGAMNMSDETRARVAATNRARGTTSLKGKTLGPYSEERKKAISEGSRKSWESGRQSPKSNLGKRTSDETKAKISAALKGRPSPMKGRTPHNKGQKTGPLPEETKAKMRGRTPHNKGSTSPNKGKTYEELYGPEKASELKEARRLAKIRFWSNNLLTDQ